MIVSLLALSPPSAGAPKADPASSGATLNKIQDKLLTKFQKDITEPRDFYVTFDANADQKLPWKFEPVEKSVRVRIGENRLVAFRAVNEANFTTKGTATYNVTPFAAGQYFNKIQCFCFEQQQLAAHQSANFPVSFFIDPAILDDPELRDVTNITLSYTFFSYESANKSKL